MQHIPAFVADLAIILITAGATVLLCRRFNQPVVLGYLVAGFLVGPYFPVLPSVTDLKSVHMWAEIGVIFLLFDLGIEFNFKKLTSIGKSASVVAAVKVAFVLGLGYFLGRIFGWGWWDSLFLGGILCISSTVLVARTFEDLNIRGSFSNLVLGVLIVEDLLAILLLVFLTTLAATKSFTGWELVSSIIQLGVFLILCFILGLYFMPFFIRKTKHLLNEETTLIMSIGCCLLMVVLSTTLGFSAALGAFIAGSIFAGTSEVNNIEKLLAPLKHLFAAIFFVSIGMLLNPAVIHEHLGSVIAISIVTVLGKTLGTFLGAVLSGYDVKTSLKSGLSLAQIGEFSFIIATLGVSLKVTSPFLYPIAVAVAVVTSFATPYLIRGSDPLYRFLEPRLPGVLLRGIQSYDDALKGNESRNAIFIIWNLYGIKLFLNSVIIVSIALLFGKVLLPFLKTNVSDSLWVDWSLFILAFIFSLPFFWPVLLGKPKDASEDLRRELSALKALQTGVIIVRSFLSILLLAFLVGQFSSLAAASSMMLLGLSLVLAPMTKYAEPLYHLLEKGFISNLNQYED